jgi:hypothetical protein
MGGSGIMFGTIKSFSKQQKQYRIGVVGISHGIGTTFSVMMMACFIRTVKKQPAAVVEQNVSGQLSGLGKEREMFRIRGIDIYGRGVKNEELEKRQYPYLFLDYGIKARGDVRQPGFLECSKKIVVASLCPWKQEELFRFVEAWTEEEGKEKFIYLFPMAVPSDVKKAEKKLGRRMYALAVQTCWYRLCPENLTVLEELFGAVGGGISWS